MTSPAPDHEGALPPRLEEFQREVDRLHLRAGRAEPERRLMVIGVALFVVGVVVVLLAFNGSSGASDARDQTDFVILALLGVLLGVGGSVMWLRFSTARYLRYWLIRLIYEERQRSDDVLQALRGRSGER